MLTDMLCEFKDLKTPSQKNMHWHQDSQLGPELYLRLGIGQVWAEPTSKADTKALRSQVCEAERCPFLCVLFSSQTPSALKTKTFSPLNFLQRYFVGKCEVNWCIYPESLFDPLGMFLNFTANCWTVWLQVLHHNLLGVLWNTWCGHYGRFFKLENFWILRLIWLSGKGLWTPWYFAEFHIFVLT